MTARPGPESSAAVSVAIPTSRRRRDGEQIPRWSPPAGTEHVPRLREPVQILRIVPGLSSSENPPQGCGAASSEVTPRGPSRSNVGAPRPGDVGPNRVSMSTTWTTWQALAFGAMAPPRQ